MNPRFVLPERLHLRSPSLPLLSAAPGMAPGLWEHNVKFKSQSGEMEKSRAEMQAEIASLPPDQRKMSSSR